eukprot:GHRQ01039495.1.p2 GENE.GHRQ01039495.1~~GHRQ01039495.1.p2  ORF type:complete len:107 (-),score=26.09 GHRQ01039495.1:21-341(-)
MPHICLVAHCAGYLWSGHEDGTVRIWSVELARAAGTPAHVADGSVTAVAVDPDTGYCWAGTAAGEVVVVRWAAGLILWAALTWLQLGVACAVPVLFLFLSTLILVC